MRGCVRRIPRPRSENPAPLHLYRWLQYASSVVGLAVVLAALIVWLRHAPTPSPPPVRRIGRSERLAWLAAYLLPPLLAMGWVISGISSGNFSPLVNGVALGQVAIMGMRGCAASLLLISVLVRARLAV